MKFTLFILLVTNISCFAQNKAYKALAKLNYNSVSLYYFNCDTNSNLIKYDLLCDTSLVDSKGKWAYTVSDTNHRLSLPEVASVIEIIKRYHLDFTSSDPVACYTPRMGIVFYNGKLPLAHIDICLECSKVMIETFDKGKIKFRESPVSIGTKTATFFKSLCLKYGLKGCRI